MELMKIENGKVTMTSREIAKLTGKQHKHVIRDIEDEANKLGGELVEPIFGLDRYVDQKGEKRKQYTLTRDGVMQIGARYDAKIRYKIIQRLKELERKPKLLTVKELLEQNAMAIAKIELERDLAIKTKAEIGNRREATAMATASVQTKRANRLEIELDKSKEYSTIKKMEMKYHGTKFNWRLLKATGKEMEINTIDVFDNNYGTVKAYHKEVWAETYALEI